MSVPAVAAVNAAPRLHGLARLRAGLAGVGAAALGAAPHLLHHAGPLAGAALLTGATGKLLFGAVGFVVAVPMLRRLRRRTGSWHVPGAALTLMAVIFIFSSFVIGPVIAGSDVPNAPSQNVPAAPPGVGAGEHEAHHR